MSNPSRPYASSASRPPATIQELAERTLDNLWDDKANLKHYLRTAERYRKDGKDLAKQGDIEAAFVLLAKAATLVLEKLPTHRDYQAMLNQEQQNNLALNGQDILDHLGELKKALLERYEDWQRKHPNGPSTEAERTPNGKLYTTLDDRDDPSPRTHPNDLHPRAAREDDEAAVRARLRDQHQRAAEEANLWRLQREATERRDAEARDMKRDAAAAAARQAARVPGPAYGVPQQQQQQSQDDFRRRGLQEQDDVIRRQQAADDQARAIRHNAVASPATAVNTTPAGIPVTPMAPNYYQSYPSLTPTQSSATTRPMSAYSYQSDAGPSIMPLENPSRYEGDSTDSESIRVDHDFNRRVAKQKQLQQPLTPSRAVYQSVNPLAVTTTSHPPVQRIGYPQLMSPHQQRQGYYPSLNSMFTPSHNNTNQPPPGPSILFSGNGSDSLYSQSMLPPPSVPVISHSYAQPPPAPQQPGPPMPSSAPVSTYANYPGPSRPAPPIPTNANTMPNIPDDTRISRDRYISSSSTITKDSMTPSSTPSTNDTSTPLKSVSLPKECLPRFIAIAKVNTANNKETCGLLLGKDKGHKFAVTTLLIPKQHATSDTCTMEEEELVLQFTEERSLITLGWIHTHPSQSCFMSSVDLHTHSGFQRMLPESFAVVCAPNSSPNFGIFRLTDPPGLGAILGCTAKDAFHPHPDLPIYTDADKGHVQMKSGTLEIVDLR